MSLSMSQWLSQYLRHVQWKQLAICPHTLNTQQWDKKRITSKNTPAHKQGNGKHVGLAILKSYQAHGSPLLRSENNFLWLLTPPSGLLVWASWWPFHFMKVSKHLQLSSFLCLLPTCDTWGSKGHFSFCTMSLSFQHDGVFSSVTLFKNFEDLLWFLLGFIPLDRSHTHKSFCNGPFLTLGFCWGTMSLSFIDLSLTKKV